MVTTEIQLVEGKNRKVLPGLLNYSTVTIHETGNEAAGAGAQSHAKLQSRGNPYPGSWHETVDHKEAIVSYEDTARVMHSGRSEGNNNSYAIEICVNSKENFVKAVHNAAERAAEKLRAKGYGVERLRQHNAWSGKNCPTHLRRGDWGITWADFVELVRAHLKGSSTPAPAPKSAPQPTPTPAPAPAPQPTQEYPAIGLLEDGDFGRRSVIALQLVIPKEHNGGVNLVPDGDFGPVTKKAVQRWLKALGHYKGAVDGDFGRMSTAALQRFLASKGKDVGPDDGSWGPRTSRAFQSYLNDQRRYL